MNMLKSENLTVSCLSGGVDTTIAKQVAEIFELAAPLDWLLLVDEATIAIEAVAWIVAERKGRCILDTLGVPASDYVFDPHPTFDDAFKLRISIPIQYRDLDESIRRTFGRTS